MLIYLGWSTIYEPGDQFSRTHTGIFSTCYATSQYIFISIKILHQSSLLLLLLVQEFSSYPMLRLFCYLTKTPLFILSFFQWFCFLLANTCSSNLQASLTLLITFIALIPTFTVTFLQIYCFLVLCAFRPFDHACVFLLFKLLVLSYLLCYIFYHPMQECFLAFYFVVCS
jgi:hypothetical protein